MTRTYRFGSRETGFEKILSGALMVMAPVPCLVAGFALARDGYWAPAWAFLGLSIAVEVLVSIERALAVRAAEAFRAEWWPGWLRLTWPGESVEVPTGGIDFVRARRGLLGGSAEITAFTKDGSRFELPAFGDARALAGMLESEGVAVSRAVSLPLSGLLATLALTAGAVLHALFGAHPALSMSALLLALPAAAAGYPIRRRLGPKFKMLDTVLLALASVAAIAGLVPALSVSGSSAAFPRGPALPAHGADRSRAIFESAVSGEAEAASRLLSLAASPDPRDRRDATIALWRFRGPAVIAVMRASSKDADADVRRAAAAALAGMEDEAGPGLLLSMLDADPDIRVVREANASLERCTGFKFSAGGSAAPLSEADRRMAVAFWRQALYHGGAGLPDQGD